MKIAFITYEYPPDTAYGGIATYTYQVAKMLQKRGNHVEVFTCSHCRHGKNVENGIITHRIYVPSKNHRSFFSEKIAPVFKERHNEVRFDVLEGAEADAHTRKAIQLVPDIPLVIKLHTPTFLVDKINYLPPSFIKRTRYYIGALRRGQRPIPYPYLNYDTENDIERLHTLEADEITTPSQALGDKLVKTWNLPEYKVVCIPNPYEVSQTFLSIPPETNTNVVAFVGRLEVRKGILDLVQAIPKILRQCPDTKFLFIGESGSSPNQTLSMQHYIEKKLNRYRESLIFKGKVSLEEVPLLLASSDLCVLPSRWENFPNVCLEAMAAARGIIGSHSGGISEMLNFGQVGRLIPPNSPQKLAEVTIELLRNRELRIEMGKAARERVLKEYSLEQIGTLQEASYLRAIQRRSEVGQRR